jgi:hypothetical protein
VGRLQALLQRTCVANGTADDATADLVQPLLPPEPAEADSQLQLSADLPPDHDPFPATTAARAAAAEMARSRAMAAGPTDNIRAVLMGRSAAAAASAVAGKSAEALRFERKLAFASGLSWVVNILLLVAKLYAYWLSHSKAVLASAADSAVDLVSLYWYNSIFDRGCCRCILCCQTACRQARPRHCFPICIRGSSSQQYSILHVVGSLVATPVPLSQSPTL